MSTSLQLLKSRKFLPLFIAQFFGAFNDNILKNAFLIWFTYEISFKTGVNAGFINSLAALLFILPFLLFSYFAGKIADKYEKSTLLRKIKLVEIILMLFCFVGFYLQNHKFLLTLLFLMGAQSAMFGPLKYSMPKQLLQPTELIYANSLIESSTFLAILFGTIFGTILIRSEFGIEIICASLILFAIIGFIASFFVPKITIIKSHNLQFNFLQFVKDKSGTIPKINAIILISWFWLIGTVFLTQFPIFSKEIIKGDEKIVSLFLIIFSIGIAIGSLFYAKITKGKINIKLAKIAIIGISVSMICLYFVSLNYQGFEGQNLTYFLNNGQLIILSMLLIAICAGIYVVPIYSSLQISAKNEFIARIIAINNIFNAFFMVLASIIMIILFKIDLKITEIFLIFAILNLFMVFLMKNKDKS